MKLSCRTYIFIVTFFQRNLSSYQVSTVCSMKLKFFFIQFLAFQISVHECIYFAAKMSLKRIGGDTAEGKVMCLNISLISLNVRIGSALKANVHDALSVPYKFVSAGQTINSQLVRNLWFIAVYMTLH